MTTLRHILLACLLVWCAWVAWHLCGLTWRYCDARWGETPRDGSSFVADYPFYMAWTLTVGGIAAFVLAALLWGVHVHRRAPSRGSA